MRRFLDRHFDVIRHKGFWEKERDYIDRSLVKEWSKSKMWMFWLWTLNSGIFYSLGHYNDRIFMQMLSLVFVISAGFWRTDSWAALHCLEKLGMPQYRPKNFSEGAVVDRELIADPDLFVK